MKLTWIKPEDLIGHELRQSAEEGKDVAALASRWEAAVQGMTDATSFRSLAEAMGAAVHITVTGDDDHHKTEAVYKAFGRALRQAIRIEGDAVPSTKGVL